MPLGEVPGTSPAQPTMFAPALVGLALSVSGSWAPALSGDEQVTLRFGQSSPEVFWTELGRLDAVHAVYYLLMRPWIAAFGSSPFILRLPSAVAVALAVAAVTAIGSRLAGRRVAVLAGLVMAVLPVTSHYGMTARSYALTCALVAWAGYTLVRATDPGASRGWWAAYGVLLACACLVFAFAILVGVAHAVGVALSRRSSLRTHVLVLVAVATARRRRTEPGLLALTLPWLLLPAAILLLVSMVRPVFAARYVFFSEPALALLVGYGLERLRRRELVAAGALVVALSAPLWLAGRLDGSQPATAPPGAAALVEPTRTDASGPVPPDDVHRPRPAAY